MTKRGKRRRKRKKLTWGRIRIILGELHKSFEVAPIVGGVGVENDQPDSPIKNIFLVQLDSDKPISQDVH